MGTTRYLRAIFSDSADASSTTGTEIEFPLDLPDLTPPAFLQDPLPSLLGRWRRVSAAADGPPHYVRVPTTGEDRDS